MAIYRDNITGKIITNNGAIAKNASCCCNTTGAMCICEASQDYDPGCYENVNATIASDEGGIYLGDGSDCFGEAGLNCGNCCDQSSTTSLCCTAGDISWLSPCDCTSSGGTPIEYGESCCEENNNPSCCTGYADPLDLPPGTTDVWVKIKTVYLFQWTWDWGCLDCHFDGQYNIQTEIEESSSEARRHFASVALATAYLATINNSDYDNSQTCDGVYGCCVGGTSYISKRTTYFMGYFLEDCCPNSQYECTDPCLGIVFTYKYTAQGKLSCSGNPGFYQEYDAGYSC